jgi:hypothetical protein
MKIRTPTVFTLWFIKKYEGGEITENKKFVKQ